MVCGVGLCLLARVAGTWASPLSCASNSELGRDRSPSRRVRCSDRTSSAWWPAVGVSGSSAALGASDGRAAVGTADRDRVSHWSSWVSFAGASARALDTWFVAVVGVFWTTRLGGGVAAAGFALAYGAALRACRVHRPLLGCAGTTWVLGYASLRAVLSLFGERDGQLASVAALGIVGVLWWSDRLPFGLDWSEFPFVGVELQPFLLDAFPEAAALRAALRLNWVREWDAWGDTVVAVREAETTADQRRAAGDFVKRLQELIAEHSPDRAGSSSPDSRHGSDSDVEMLDAEGMEDSGEEDASGVEWTEFPFVGLELRPLLRKAFPDSRDLRRVLRRPWVREMDSWGDAVVSIREASGAAAAERAGAAFLANLRRLVALHMQPVLPTNLERLIELGG